MSGPEKIKTILSNSAGIQILAEIARTNLKVEDILLQYLPSDLREDIAVGHLKDGKLTLLTTGPVIATKIRYISPELLENIKKHAPSLPIKCIEVKISHKIQK
ncbi:MAG: DciA family protein [Pseudomonadota bacterium]|nr:DciA family protein [Pseudomonadota bacterium]